MKKTHAAGERATDCYIVLMLLAFPLFTGFEGYAALTVSKYIFFTSATALWLLTLIGLLLFGGLRPRRLRAVHYAVLAFMSVCCLSAALSPYGKATLLGAGRYDGLVTLLLYGLIFLGVSLTCRPKRLYVWSLGVSTLLCCLVAVLQLSGGNPLGLYPGDMSYYDSGVRYSGSFLGTIGNADLLSGFLCLSVPLCAVTAMRDRKERARLSSMWLLLPAAFGLAVLLLSGVAGGVVGIAGCCLVSLPALAKKRRAALLISLGAVLLGLAALWLLPAKSGTLYELSQVLRGNLDDSFGSSRVLIWRRTLELFPERPLLGGGPDTLPLRLDIIFSRYVEETGRTLSTYVDNAHCEYLGYLVNVGAAGLLCYLTAMALSLIRWFRRSGDRLSPALGCCLVCYWVSAAFGLGLCVVLPVMWILWGVLEANES